jgi:hypothetical protein
VRNQKLDTIFADAKWRVAEHWAGCLEAGLPDHSAAAHAAVDEYFQAYFEQLRALPEPADKAAIMKVLKTLFANLDGVMTEYGGGLLETDERELLCPPIIEAAEIAGLLLSEFEYGDPTLEFREF